MIIYSLTIDANNHKIFVMPPLDSRVGDIDDFDTGIKKADNWIPPCIKWYEENNSNIEKYKDPDISLISHPGSLILSPNTANIVKTVINDVAELLPVSFNNETWSLLNVYNVIDAVDKPNCQYKIRKNGKVGRLKKLAFFPDKIPHAKLFKVPENPASIYFAEHHFNDSENNFKNIIEKNKLFGIKFIKVWEN